MAYANVFIVGTTMGGMSGHDGTFSIDSIPAGTYTLRVQMMTYDTAEVAGLIVEGAATVQREIRLQKKSASNRIIAAPGGSGTCEVHGRKMLSVLVPVAYGLRVFDPKFEAVREARFPHAESSYDGGCVVVDGSPCRATVLMCPECVAACNRFKGSDVWDVATASGRDLQPHKFADVMEFSMPPNAETENVVEACRQTSVLRTDSVTVRIAKGDWYFVADECPRKFDREATVIQAGAAAEIGVVESGDSMDVYVTFLATPVDTETIIMRIQVQGREGLGLAAAIVRSVRFPAS